MNIPELAPERKNISSYEILQQLPALFSGKELMVAMQWPSKKASQQMWFWKNRNMVAPLGGHSDIFANLVRDKQPNWEGALLMARPSAVIIGVECLRRAGWTTQVSYRPEVAISYDKVPFTTEHFEMEQRPPTWFQRVDAGIDGALPVGVVSDLASCNAPALRPAWALADMLARKGWGACGLTPDDIDCDDIHDAGRRDWIDAAEAFELSTDSVAELDLRPRHATHCQR